MVNRVPQEPPGIEMEEINEAAQKSRVPILLTEVTQL